MPKKLSRHQILEQAAKDVNDREDHYGKPAENFERLAVLMNAWKEVKPGQFDDLDGIVFHIMSNLARLVEDPSHKGSWENLAGYAAIGGEICLES